MLNGMTNGSNCILLIVFKGLPRQKYNIPGIYPLWTNQCAFPAQHTLLNAFQDLIILSALYQDMKLAKTEFCYVSCCACGRTAAALYTNPEAWLPFKDIFSNFPAVCPVIDLAPS